MASYRANHVPKDKIAMVPIAGYLNRTNYSRDSIRWLEYEARMKNINIRHALNGNGEVKINSISVDGFCAETKTVFLYQVYLCLL